MNEDVLLRDASGPASSRPVDLENPCLLLGIGELGGQVADALTVASHPENHRGTSTSFPAIDTATLDFSLASVWRRRANDRLYLRGGPQTGGWSRTTAEAWSEVVGLLEGKSYLYLVGDLDEVAVNELLPMLGKEASRLGVTTFTVVTAARGLLSRVGAVREVVDLLVIVTDRLVVEASGRSEPAAGLRERFATHALIGLLNYGFGRGRI